MGEGAGPAGLRGFVSGMYLHALIQGCGFFSWFRTTAVHFLICWK